MPRTKAVFLRAIAVAGALCLVSTRTASGHEAVVSPGNFASTWSFELPVLLGLVGLIAGFELGRRSLAPQSAGRWQMLAFYAGFLALALALLSPLDAVSSSLAGVHMVQHLVLISIAAPLFAAARIEVVLARSLPRPVARALSRTLDGRRLAYAADTYALLALAAFTLVLWLWHFPGIYDAAVSHDAVHGLEHVSLLLTAYAFWRFVFIAGRGMAIVASFLAAVQCSALGALLLLSPHVWYDSYVVTSASWGLTALEDQQLAGAVMWVPGGVVYLLAAAWFFVKLLDEAGAAARAREEAARQGLTYAE